MASITEVAALLQRPQGLKDWWREIEESVHIARARPDFHKNIQKLVTVSTFITLVLFAGALLLLRHAPLSGIEVLGGTETLVKNPLKEEDLIKDEDLLANPPQFVELRLQRNDWMGMHEKYSREAKEREFDVLFLGDSITEGWLGTQMDRPRGDYSGNKEMWDELNTDLGATAGNFAIAGDRVLHLLWRMQNGELPAHTPKVLILCIGVNDLLSGQPVDETFDHMKRLLDFFSKNTPQMSVALLSVLPTAVDTGSHTGWHKEPSQLNQKLEKLEGERIRFVDCTSVFADGESIKEDLFLPDLLHLSGEGYRKWAHCFKPAVRKLLKKHERRRLHQ